MLRGVGTSSSSTTATTDAFIIPEDLRGALRDEADWDLGWLRALMGICPFRGRLGEKATWWRVSESLGRGERGVAGLDEPELLLEDRRGIGAAGRLIGITREISALSSTTSGSKSTVEIYGKGP